MKKYLLIPFHLFRFWYPESLYTFIRTWKNLILYLEEDLALGLMWKLLLVPLFHDSSIVGRILSIIFRISRILIGLFAFAIATVAVAALSLFWFSLPLTSVLGIFGYWGWLIFLSGVGLFVIHLLTHPHKAIWQVSSGQVIWDASWIKKKNLNMQILLNNFEVKNFLSLLEIAPDQFNELQIQNPDEVAQVAFDLAKRSGSKYICPTHFFTSIVKNSPILDNFFLQVGLSTDDFEKALIYSEKKKNKWRKVWIWDDDFAIHHLRGVNRGWLGVPTPSLDSVSTDITKIASRQYLPDFIGRQMVVSEVLNILSQEGSRNVVLVGPPGSGKSTLIHFLGKLIIAGDAPSALAIKRVVLLDTTRLLSGMKTQGELADRVKNVFDEVNFAQNIIVVVEEIHNLGIGEAGSSMNVYSLLQPFLESSAFQFIATTEPENYSRILEKQGAFARLFTKIEILPATPDETIQILEDRAIEAERKNKIKVSFIAIKKCVELSAKLIHDRVLPDSALATLDEALTLSENEWITFKVIENVLSKRVNVPIVELGNVGKEKLLNLEEEIHHKLIDQEEAVKVVSDSLRRSATGLREGNRPIGSFLFVGPTGVGKTELAKILAEVYFKTSGAFIRFDMSEYQTGESVSQLVGEEGNGGVLTEAVRNKPYALILLDEFEKADPKILTLFLQVLEDGRLTDGTGRTIDFSNTIIIATSNAASLTIAHGLEAGKSLEDLDKEVNEELLQIFKPELINRFDDVVLFKPLTQPDLQKIVRLKLDGLQKQMHEQGYLVEFDEALVAELAKKGFDKVLGARSLRRLIQDTLEANLSKMILEGKLVKGNSFMVGMEML